MTISSERVDFPNRQGIELAGRLERPLGRIRAWAIFAHCFTCSKDSAAATRIARELARRGIALLRFDFTGLGASGGDFANTNFSSNVDDLVAAADWLRAEHAAPALLVGHSLGGAAVIAASARIPEVRAVATIGAPSEPDHLRHLFADRDAELAAQGQIDVELGGRRFTIQQQFLDDLDEQRLAGVLAKFGKALLVMHSPLDEIVSIDHARRLYEAARGPRSFVSLDDADHLLTQRADSEYAAEVLAAWASRYVQAPDDAEATEEGRVVVASTGERFLQRVRAGEHEFWGDEPQRAGGSDAGPSPYDFLLAGLGTCTSMTLEMYARHKGWPLEGVRVELAHDRIHASDCERCESTDGRVDRIERTIALEGPLDDAQRARLLEIADRCPVHRTLENEIVIATSPAE